MKKITILIFCFFLSINVFADEWPHENISNAEFALDVVDRVPINIIEEHLTGEYPIHLAAIGSIACIPVGLLRDPPDTGEALRTLRA